jgi:hypothetical protein
LSGLNKDVFNLTIDAHATKVFPHASIRASGLRFDRNEFFDHQASVRGTHRLGIFESSSKNRNSPNIRRAHSSMLSAHVSTDRVVLNGDRDASKTLSERTGVTGGQKLAFQRKAIAEGGCRGFPH